MNPLEQYHWIGLIAIPCLFIAAALIKNISEKTSNLILIISMMIIFGIILNDGLKYGLLFQSIISFVSLIKFATIAIKEIKSDTI